MIMPPSDVRSVLVRDGWLGVARTAHRSGRARRTILVLGAVASCAVRGGACRVARLCVGGCWWRGRRCRAVAPSRGDVRPAGGRGARRCPALGRRWLETKAETQPRHAPKALGGSGAVAGPVRDDRDQAPAPSARRRCCAASTTHADRCSCSGPMPPAASTTTCCPLPGLVPWPSVPCWLTGTSSSTGRSTSSSAHPVPRPGIQSRL